MKKKILFLLIFLSITICLNTISFTTGFAETEVYLCGMPVGFKLDNKGATIIGVNDVISKNGLSSPSRDCGIKTGDILLSIDGKEINNACDIEEVLFGYEGNGVTAVIDRDGEILIKIVYPAEDVCGTYRMGLFIRDDVTGIGTVTYIKDDGSFGALGHPVVEGSYQKIVKINSGLVYRCCITGVNKGVRGKAGEIRGYFIEDEEIGSISSNLKQGLYGSLTQKFIKENNLKKVSIAEAKPGKASIYSTIDGTTPKEYSLNIIKCDTSAPENKNLVIKITDEELLEKTGGILQGMSGSPIVQNGSIVGAITHVFINDPTRGFGISIENMLSA